MKSVVLCLVIFILISGCSDNAKDPGPLAQPFEREVQKIQETSSLVNGTGSPVDQSLEFEFIEGEIPTAYNFFNGFDERTFRIEYKYLNTNLVQAKRFIVNLPGSSNLVLADSIIYEYNNNQRNIAIEAFRRNNENELVSSRLEFIRDENARIVSQTEFAIFSGNKIANRKLEFEYDGDGNLEKRTNFVLDFDTGELEPAFFRVYEYGETKNPFFNKEVSASILRVVSLNEQLSPKLPVFYQNFNFESDNPVTTGTIEYINDAEGFPVNSELIFVVNSEPNDEGTIVETEYTYFNN